MRAIYERNNISRVFDVQDEKTQKEYNYSKMVYCITVIVTQRVLSLLVIHFLNIFCKLLQIICIIFLTQKVCINLVSV